MVISYKHISQFFLFQKTEKLGVVFFLYLTGLVFIFNYEIITTLHA